MYIHRQQLFFLFKLILLFLFFPNSSYSNTSFENTETSITSDELLYHTEEQKIIFNRNVKVQRTEFELTAEQLIIYLKKQPDQPMEVPFQGNALPSEMINSEIKKIVAKDNVRITQEKHIGTCNTATYNEETGVILLEGSPILTNGKNSITGEKIRYFTREQRSEIVGSNNKRVEAKFTTNTNSLKIKEN